MVELNAGLIAQQAVAQQKIGISMLKQAAQSQQAIANMVAETVSPSTRGRIVDIAA